MTKRIQNAKELQQKFCNTVPEIKRRPKKGLRRILGTSSARICGFVLTGSFWSGQPALKSRLGDAKSSIGVRVPPYNLSTGLHPKDIELKQIFQESAMYISRALWIHSVPTNCRIKSNVEDSLEVKTLTSFQYCDAAHGMKQHDSFSQRP